MQAKEWTTVDKSAWPSRGPWDSEPDKAQWSDATTGLPCLIHRGPYGSLCGYVGVSADHPDFKCDYNDVDVEVHGGLNYASFCSEVTDESKGICHTPGPGEPNQVWWLGFDCAHAGDIRPKYEEASWRNGCGYTYKEIEFVRQEVRALALQLAQRS